MSALTLNATGTVAGVAGSATSITVTIFGAEKTTANSYTVLYQGQLPAVAATLYGPVVTGAQALISTITLANTTAGPVTATLFVNGTGTTNQIFNATIPSNGTAAWAGDGWRVMDASGATLTTFDSSGYVPNTRQVIAGSGLSGGGTLASDRTFDVNVDGTTLEVVADTLQEKDGGTTNAKLANMGAATFKMRALGAGTGVPIDGTATQAKTALAITPSDITGLTFFATLANLSGDVSTAGTGATTLATVNANVGSFGSATQVMTQTVDAKGRTTAAANVAIQITEAQVTNLVTDLAGKQPTGNYITSLTTDVTAAGPGAAAATIANNAVTNAKAADMGAHTFKGNNTGSTADPLDLSIAQMQAELGVPAAFNAFGVVTGNSGTATADAAPDTIAITGSGQASTTATDTPDGLVVAVPLLSGDISSVAGGATTLPNVNSNVGSFGTASSVGQFTVNAKGLTTAAAAVPIVIAEAQVTNLVTDLAGKQATGNYVTALTGDVTATGPGSATATLATVNSNVGTFGSATQSAVVTADAKGRITAVSNVTINPLTGWIDVARQGANAYLPGNTAAQNITAINAIHAAAPAGSTIYIPGGTYQNNAAWTMPAGKQFSYKGQGAGATGGNTLLNWNANVGGNIITLPAGIWYWRWEDLNFTCSVSQTAGALINIAGAAGTNFFNCTFTSTFGGFWNDVLFGDTPGVFPSNQSWNSAIIQNCVISGYKGRGIYCDSLFSSLVVENSVIQGQWGGTGGTPAAAMALAGIEVQNCGALQIGFCDVLGNINNLLSDPAVGKVSASIFCTNTYFDSSGGSCIKFAGAGATVRARFDTCSFTTAGTNFTTPGTNLSAVELAGTFAYSANGQGVDFVNCNVLNTFFTTGTTNGFLITNAADYSVTASRIAGWTNGSNVTPIATAGRTRPIMTGNTIGPTTDYAGNAVGLLWNAGAAAYGTMVVTGNNLVGNTSAPMTDNSAVGVTDSKLFSNNAGYMDGAGQLPLLSSGGAAVIAGRGAVTSGTTNTFLYTARIPANGVRVGQQFRIRMETQSSAAGVPTFNVHLGAAGTIAGDAIICPVVLAAQAINSYQTLDVIVSVVALGPTATVTAHGRAGGNAATGAAQTAAPEIIPNVPTTAAWFITVGAACGTTGTLTVRNASIEAL